MCKQTQAHAIYCRYRARIFISSKRGILRTSKPAGENETNDICTNSTRNQDTLDSYFEIEKNCSERFSDNVHTLLTGLCFQMANTT